MSERAGNAQGDHGNAQGDHGNAQGNRGDAQSDHGNAQGEHVAIDWDALRTAAREASTHAYAPYSEVKVGAAALTTDGRIITGCNVENASYGVGMCAECILVGNLALAGGGTLVAFDCVDSTGETLMPCGRCRQLLAEHAAPARQRNPGCTRTHRRQSFARRRGCGSRN